MGSTAVVSEKPDEASSGLALATGLPHAGATFVSRYAISCGADEKLLDSVSLQFRYRAAPTNASTNNTAADGHPHTAPVFAFGAQNELGLYNMIGNVWEWVDDYWGLEHPRTPPGTPALRDPRGVRTTGERTKKGGSYMCHRSYCYRYRVQARSQNEADTGTSNLGVRCARDA